MLTGAWKAFELDAISLTWLFAVAAPLLLQMGMRVLTDAGTQRQLTDLDDLRRRLASVEATARGTSIYRSGFPM